MGTAVLFPQDCLRPRSRHKHQTSEMMYAPECAPISRRNPLARARSQGAGLLPLPGQSGRISPMNIPRQSTYSSHFKCRKGAEQSDIDLSSRTVPDVPVYKILQRPKVVDDVKARSVTLIEKNTSSKIFPNDVKNCNNCVEVNFEMPEVHGDGVDHVSKGSGKGGSVFEPKYMSGCLNGVRTSIVEGYKLSSAKVGAVKQKNALNYAARGLPSKLVTKSFVYKLSDKATDVSCKAVSSQVSEEPQNLSRLRRTSTEPQIISTHALGQYKSKAIHASFQKSKSESHGYDRGLFGSTSSLSCQERWAGPAYTSSPSPSSLPIPKLCLPQTRFSSLQIPPLVKQYSSSVYMQPFLGPSVPSDKEGGAWDVAFATKSLRKMLNLDAC